MSASFAIDARSIGIAAASAMGPHAAPPSFGADEALRAAHRVAAALRAGADPVAFASSGLGTLTVPRSHQGPGLSFEAVAHAVRILAEADRDAGEALRHHLCILAAVDVLGGARQRTELFSLALRGLRFGRPVSGPGNMPLRLMEQGGRLTIEGSLDPVGAREVLAPHLLPIRVRDDQNRSWHAIADAEIVSARRRDASSPLPVDRDRLLPLAGGAGLDDEHPLEAIRLLLRASVDTGLAGRALADRIRQLRDGSVATGRSVDADAIERVGGLRLKLDAATALLEKAGRAVDRATIRPTASSVALAQISASGASILAAELAEHAGVARPRVSSHRTRRIGRLDPNRSRYALLGAFYLNGASSRPSS